MSSVAKLLVEPFLFVVIVGFLANACGHSAAAYQPIPENPWLVVYKSSGGPAPVITQVALYRDGRIIRRADSETLHQTRLTEIEITRLSQALVDPEIPSGVAKIAAVGYQSGCCDMEDIVMRGEIEFELACTTEPPPTSVAHLLSTINEVVRAHFGPVQISCEG